MTRSITIFLLLSLLLAAKISAQVLPRAGTHFTFGIPEGPDALVDPILGAGTSILTVNILSVYDGKGIITSPNGYCREFTFSSNVVTTIDLPFIFMHLTDIGKTNKGLLIKTSQPANVVFHDFLEEAGEATQIYPDDALDTSYRVTTWGVVNDPPDNFGQENNHSEFIVTATKDSTDVTITPSINTLGGHQAHIPINISLNRGECYIVKADSSDFPTNISLTNSLVHASKPVSILSAVTCAYVPLSVQSCNEVLDEILPRRSTDTVFYVVPLRDSRVANTVLFTSETLDFWVISTNGFSYHATNGTAVAEISRPGKFTVTAPAQCFLLSEGSTIQDLGDPSIVTVMPREQYTDTLLWFTPSFRSLNTPFTNYISVIYPKASESNVLLDGSPISSLANPQTIVSSAMSAAVAIIEPGVHKLTSPVPIFAMASGFMTADAYSFIPGTIGPKQREDTLPAILGISSSDAKTCRTFDVDVTSSFHSQDDVTSVNLNLTYDPSILTVVSVKLGSVARVGTWVIDNRISGVITISASCLQPFTDSGAIATVTFSTGPMVTRTTVTGNLQEMGGEQKYSALANITEKIIYIREIRDTIKASFSLDAGHSHFGDYDTATIRLLSVPNETVSELDFFITYNHDLMSLQFADMRNTLIPGFTTILPTTVDPLIDEIIIPIKPPMLLPSSGIVARLLFKTYVSDSTSGEISLRAVVGNSRPCPLDIVSDQAKSEFIGSDTCGTQSLRSLMLHEPFIINSIIPNPSYGTFTISVDRYLFGEPLHISLIDMLGNDVWSTYHSSPDIHENISCSLEHRISNGSYFIRITGSGRTETRKIVIRN